VSSYAPTIDIYAKLAATKAAALRRSPAGFFAGAMLAGTYIGIAMILALSTGSGLPAGVRPLVMGATFGIGLILTAFAGAELFTGYVMYLGFGLARRTITRFC
jgi:formate/nitrite transporter FocA (FNT family)